jgi:GT2 family glycosyltransferase
MMSSSCALSLVVCTRNRVAQLSECLQVLERLLPGPSWELIVVDNGSSDETPKFLKQYSGSLPLQVVREPRPGLGGARNRGWRAAQGELIAFTDDDCYPSPDFLRAIAAAFAESDAIGFVGGPVMLYDPLDVHMSIKESLAYETFPASSFIPAGAIHGANFAFRRSTLEMIDGFDELFGAGAPFFSAEDTDALGRALAAGWTGVYNPRIVVTHNHGRRGGGDVALLARHYSRGRGAYYAKALLNSRQRYTYAKSWYWAVRRQPWRNSMHEIAAGIEYLFRRLGPRGARS